MNRRPLFGKLLSIALVVAGNFIYAGTVKLFLLPANLISSGTTGIALVLNHLLDFPMPVFIFLFNVAMLIVSLIFLGKQMFLTTILSSILYPIFLGLLDRVLGDVSITDNTLLNVIFAGLGVGVALGLVLRQGASTGGLDIPLLILKKYFGVPYVVGTYIFDFCVILSQMFFHAPEDLLYGVLMLVITTISLDKALLFGTTKTEVKIVSKKSDEISREILSELDRGVTLLYGRGAYLGADTEIVLSVVSNREVTRIQRLVRSIDPECFMTVSRVTEVIGKGFSLEKEYR